MISVPPKLPNAAEPADARAGTAGLRFAPVRGPVLLVERWSGVAAGLAGLPRLRRRLVLMDRRRLRADYSAATTGLVSVPIASISTLTC